MSDDKEEVDILRGGFDRLQSEFDQFSTYFYEALFSRAPGLRSLFRDDLTGQGMKFMTTLREISLHVNDAKRESERLEELGTFHANVGVTKENFVPMEEALIDTLRHSLGDELTPELESAWRRAYFDMSTIMIRKGGIS